MHRPAPRFSLRLVLLAVALTAAGAPAILAQDTEPSDPSILVPDPPPSDPSTLVPGPERPANPNTLVPEPNPELPSPPEDPDGGPAWCNAKAFFTDERRGVIPRFSPCPADLAAGWLRSRQVQVTLEPRTNPRTPKDIVVEHDPGPGQPWQLARRGVTLFVSTGQEVVRDSFTVLDAPAVTEGAPLRFRITRSPSPNRVEVGYRTGPGGGDGDAVAGEDFTAVERMVVFEPNDIEEIVEIATRPVPGLNGERRVQLILDERDSYDRARPEAFGRIFDDGATSTEAGPGFSPIVPPPPERTPVEKYWPLILIGVLAVAGLIWWLRKRPVPIPAPVPPPPPPPPPAPPPPLPTASCDFAEGTCEMSDVEGRAFAAPPFRLGVEVGPGEAVPPDNLPIRKEDESDG